jgi:hypothetical protein
LKFNRAGSRATCLGISVIIITTATGDTATADGVADGEELPLTWFITEPQLVFTIPPTLILLTTLTITVTTIGTALPWGRINLAIVTLLVILTITTTNFIKGSVWFLNCCVDNKFVI